MRRTFPRLKSRASRLMLKGEKNWRLEWKYQKKNVRLLMI